MADNPKSLASLADELERLAKLLWKRPKAIDECAAAMLVEQAAAALRAPADARQVEAIARKAVKPLRDYANEETDGRPHARDQGEYPFRSDCEHCQLHRIADGIEAALATPSPTIAAPSPSNEVTEEMLDAALEAFVESENVPDTRHDTEAMRAAIEAALKARKPADEGAGQ